MSECCPVTYYDAIVGHLNFTNEGLYRRYDGAFQFVGDGIYRICAITPSGRIQLGVCWPKNGMWYIRGRIAAKKFDLKDASFIITSADKSVTKIPLKKNAAFAYLDQLDSCRVINGTNGIEMIIPVKK